jgi:hypothetical protein
MANVSNLVKTIQDIMRKDAGTYGDAQRLEQLGWMFFLKIFDDREQELATIATVFRHACILGCAISGRPCFSRFGPVAQLLGDWGLCSAWSDEFPELYAYRLYASGRILLPAKPTAKMARLWCDRADVLLNQLGVRLYEPSRALPCGN